ELLAEFAATRSEAAFAVLVERHGALVRGVARRVLRDDHACDDVFQATFLLLARKAGTVAWRESVGPWLHTAAVRLASEHRRGERRRKRYEQQTNRPLIVETYDDRPAIDD